jgi:hypothetical protein
MENELDKIMEKVLRQLDGILEQIASINSSLRAEKADATTDRHMAHGVGMYFPSEVM